MNPGRPVILAFAVWLFCSFFYSVFMHLRGRSGIYFVAKSMRREKEVVRRARIKPLRIMASSKWKYALYLLRREWHLFCAAMFFSAMSAFNIGFRDINFGRWLRLLTKREYDVKAFGWTRVVAGFQSLISVYFIALWVLTYFGRPFE
jgi:hypothetical protein